MSVDLNQTNINPKDYQSLLEDLQGNILKEHGRDYSVHLFLKFRTDSAAAKKWIRSFAEGFVTSAKRQLEESDRFQLSNYKAGLFANFFLSASGYKALGFELKGKRRKFPAWTFLVGMKGFQKGLHDPPIEEWEKGFQEDIDAFILLAESERKNLQEKAKTV
ncbi:MAG: peroxidase, partial [Coleofasciculus sp. S288]|nr:peroxidase [Coleofasciculus sp. S288]